MRPLPGTSDFRELLQRLQGDAYAVDFAARLGVPPTTFKMAKRGERYPTEKLVDGLLRALPEHSEEIVAAYGQIPPRDARPRRRRTSLSPRESEFQQSITELIKSGREAEGRAGIQRALKSSAVARNRLWLLDQLTDLEFAAGNFEAGIAAWKEALGVAVEASLDDDEVELRLRLGSRLMHRGRHAEALVILDDGLGRDPSAGRLWRRKAIVHWHLHEYATAYAALMTAKANGVPLDVIRHTRGQVLAEWGNYESAVQDLSNALRRGLPPERAAYVRTTRAFAYAKLGKTKLATREFAAAERVTPDNGWLHYFRALSYGPAEADKGEIVQSLKRAVECDLPPLNAKKLEQALALLRAEGVEPPREGNE